MPVGYILVQGGYDSAISWFELEYRLYTLNHSLSSLMIIVYSIQCMATGSTVLRVLKIVYQFNVLYFNDDYQ